MKINNLQTYNIYSQRPCFYGKEESSGQSSLNSQNNDNKETGSALKIPAALLLMYMLAAAPTYATAARSIGAPLEPSEVTTITETTQKIGSGISKNNECGEISKLILALKTKLPEAKIKKLDKTSMQFQSNGLTVELIKQFEGNFHIRAYQDGTNGDYPLFYLNVSDKHGSYTLSPLTKPTIEILKNFPANINGHKFVVNNSMLATIKSSIQTKPDTIMGVDKSTAATLLITVLTVISMGGAGTWQYKKRLKAKEEAELAALEAESLKKREEAKAIEEAERANRPNIATANRSRKSRAVK